MKVGLNKVQVVMISTNEKSFITKNIKRNILAPIQTYKYGWYDNFKNQHLYFFSDEKVKEGDWCLIPFAGSTKFIPYYISSKEDLKVFEEGNHPNFKIIATTDESLAVDIMPTGFKSEVGALSHKRSIKLPQPSQDFIKVFIEKYNKGKVINWVYVEYEKIYEDQLEGSEFVLRPCGVQIKINSKNEIIITTKIKKKYSRSEVIEILHKRMEFSFGVDYDRSTTEKWASENI